MVPWRTHEWTDAESGQVKILVPRSGRRRLGSWIATRLDRPHIAVKLDEIGSSVWRACDGTSTVRDIARTLEAEFGERIEPLHERLGKFFAELERSRFIRWRELS
jgi:hypothetical protein